jgi:hypothetical protein
MIVIVALKGAQQTAQRVCQLYLLKETAQSLTSTIQIQFIEVKRL